MLSNKTALITGSTSGIGLAIATALARKGANIILNGLGDKALIDKIIQDLGSLSSGQVHYNPADMSNAEQIRDMISEAEKQFGGIDILVNNVGIQFVSPLEDFPEDKWDAIIALNLSAAFHTMKAVFSLMKQKKWGRIINIASAHGLVASPLKAAYVASKHGLVGLTKVAALEGGVFGVTCNAICPGYVWTPLVENQIESTAKARGLSKEQVSNDVLLAEHATKAFVTVEQIEALALFLCSPEATNITGAALSIDGGWTAH
jgi:3-hydroxybutyrate dehydrogenase